MDKQRFSVKELCGQRSLFDPILSTSNLVRPDFENFMSYFKVSYDANFLSNNGPQVLELERRLADFHGVKHCVTFSSGFWAIALTTMGVALSGRNEVIMPSFTYRRMADIMAWLKLTPHFCDVDPKTLAVSGPLVKKEINENTAMILAAHPIVTLCDIEACEIVAKEAGVPIIFDAVEAAMATYNGRRVGGFGYAECFSMHASKFINGFEGGYTTTNRDDLADKLRVYRGFGFKGQDNVVSFGINAKLNEMHACMALACLDQIEDQVALNREKYEAYKNLLGGVPGVRLLPYAEDQVRTFKNIIVEILPEWPFSREQTLQMMNRHGLLSRAYYYPPLHQKKTSYPQISATLEATEDISQRYIILPSGHFVTIDHIRIITDYMKSLVNHAKSIKEHYQWT